MVGFFVSIIILSGGIITFGYGLGDLAPTFLHCLWLLILIISLIVIVKKRLNLENKLTIFFSLILFLSIFLSIKAFTFDRGPEHPWNGKVFTHLR